MFRCDCSDWYYAFRPSDPESFRDFVQNHCPPYTYEEGCRLSEIGRDNLKMIRNGAIDSRALPEATVKKCIASVIWYLTQLATEKGEGFHEGMFVLSDTDQKIYKFLRHAQGVYTRFSSHFPGRVITSYGWTAACGIDISGLPARKRTVIFSPLTMLAEKSPYLMLKFEDWGTRGAHIFPHTLGYLGTFLGPTKQAGYQEEIPHPYWVNAYKAIWRKIPHEVRAAWPCVHKWGIAAIIHIYEKYRDILKEHGVLSQIGQLVDEIREHYPDAHLRTGDEVILELEANPISSEPRK